MSFLILICNAFLAAMGDLALYEWRKSIWGRGKQEVGGGNKKEEEGQTLLSMQSK